MKKNIGRVDKIVRIILAIAMLIPLAMGTVSSTVAIILAIGVVILLTTAFINFCPIWRIFGISTRKKEEQK